MLRHRREKPAKCTVEPLVGRADIEIRTLVFGERFDADSFVLLDPRGAPLGLEDAERPLLLLDSTWRLLPEMSNALDGRPRRRSISQDICTAYPRRSRGTSDPRFGLATIEALYAALHALGRADLSLLDAYHWRDAFLAQFAT